MPSRSRTAPTDITTKAATSKTDAVENDANLVKSSRRTSPHRRQSSHAPFSSSSPSPQTPLPPPLVTHSIVVDDYEHDQTRHSPSSSPTITTQPPQPAFNLELIFRDAYQTEIGSLEQHITLPELLDVIVCAGTDVSSDTLVTHWPNESSVDISYREAFCIYEKLASQYVAPHEELDRELDYDLVLHRIKTVSLDRQSASTSAFLMDMPIKEQEEAIALLYEWSRQRRNCKQIAATMDEIRRELRALNARIVSTDLTNVASKVPSISQLISLISKLGFAGLLSAHSSNESLSSIISATRNVPVVTLQHQTPIFDELELVEPTVSVPNFNMAENEEHTQTVKSMVVQTTPEMSRTIVYTFCVPTSTQVTIALRINETIDSVLARLQNMIIGVVATVPSGEVVAITKKRDDKVIRTDWTMLAAGSYTITLRFVRSLRMIEPLDEAPIVDESGNMTKAFKIALMTLFDTLDMDDDGCLNRDELETFRLLANEKSVTDEEWKSICSLYPTRDGEALTIRGFLQLQADEMRTLAEDESSEGRRRQRVVWTRRLQALGFNRCLHVSTVAPVFIELRVGCGERPVQVVGHAVHQLHTQSSPSSIALFHFYWRHASPLPYMRDVYWLRLLKTDYFAVILANNVSEPILCKLALKTSHNVTVDCDKCTINTQLKEGDSKILAVAVSHDNSWMLSVQRKTPNAAHPNVGDTSLSRVDATSVSSISYADVSIM